MNMCFKHLPCNACESDNSRPVSSALLPQRLVNSDCDGSSISVVRCENCGFYYADPMPFWSEEDACSLYDSGYFTEEWTGWWRHTKTELNPQKRLELIARHTTAEVPLFLEVGCGKGYGLIEAAKKGWQVYGQDITNASAEEIRTKTGLDIFVGELKKAGFREEFFDVIYLDSVIEHLPQPANMLQDLKQILKPGGLIYIVTPNADAAINRFRDLIFKLLNRKKSSKLLPLEPPYHVNGFSKRSIKAVCCQTGFEIRYLTVCSGANEWRKFKNKSARLRLIHLLYYPVYLIGELFGAGITIEALIEKKPQQL